MCCLEVIAKLLDDKIEANKLYCVTADFCIKYPPVYLCKKSVGCKLLQDQQIININDVHGFRLVLGEICEDMWMN